MSAEIVAVLVVPAEGDPGGLLAHGALGAFPPRLALRRRQGSEWWGEQLGWVPGTEIVAAALPLWWDGALVPEGWDRARRVMRRAPHPVGGWPEHPGEAPIARRAVAVACNLASELVVAGLASRVVRLARVDGCLVEVP